MDFVTKLKVLDFCDRYIGENPPDWMNQQKFFAILTLKMIVDDSCAPYQKEAIQEWQSLKGQWSEKLADKIGIESHNLFNL